MSHRVLIVEDSPVQRGILEDLVAEFAPEAEIVLAETGEAGLAALDRSPSPDLVLSDFNMPGLNGVLFVKEARKKGFSGKIFLISTEKSPEIIASAREAGADGYLLKPYTEPEIQGVLSLMKGGNGEFWA